MLSGKEKNKKQISEKILSFYDIVAVHNTIKRHDIHQLHDLFFNYLSQALLFIRATIDNPATHQVSLPQVREDLTAKRPQEHKIYFLLPLSFKQVCSQS